MLSFWLLLNTGKSNLGLGRFVTNSVGAGHHSVWALSCQDQVPQSKEFFRLGRVLRTTLPTGEGGVVHLLASMVVRGRRRMLNNCDLLISFFRLFLLRAQVVCVGQHMLIAGDPNADPAVIPCLAKCISASRYVDLALAYSLGAGLTPDVTW